MPLKIRDLESSLPNKGFVAEDQKKHRYFKFKYQDKDWGISTFVSHGEKEIKDPTLIARMAKQVKLSKKKFEDLVACPLTFDAYLDELRSAGHLAGEEP
jgi:hypothetical protein